jgi:type IV pilus assembly protein PilO
MSVLNQFQNLNPQDPGAWPPLPKLVALVVLLIVVLVAAYFVDWSDQLNNLRVGEAEEERLKADYVSKKGQAVNLDLYKQQLGEIGSSFGALLRQLPDKSEMDSLVVDINQAGLGRGLSFELFKPAQSETMHEFYAELPIAVKLKGSYHDIGAFASDIGQLPRIVTLNDMTLAVNKDGGLQLETTAKTFRYLNDDEVASQRAAADAAAKSTKKGRK